MSRGSGHTRGVATYESISLCRFADCAPVAAANNNTDKSAYKRLEPRR